MQYRGILFAVAAWGRGSFPIPAVSHTGTERRSWLAVDLNLSKLDPCGSQDAPYWGSSRGDARQKRPADFVTL